MCILLSLVDALHKSHGAQTDMGNWEVQHENKAVCGKTLMNFQNLKGESTRNIFLKEVV